MMVYRDGLARLTDAFSADLRYDIIRYSCTIY